MAKIKDDRPKIQMLLDIENIFGESTRGLGQFILALLLMLIPPIIIGYTSAYLFIPWQILIIICTVWAIRMMLIVMGHEPARVENFKRTRDDAFSMTNSMCNIRLIHPQGCVEYINGSIGFFVVTYNSTSTDVLVKSRMFDYFINTAVGKQPFDIYIQNINDTKELDNKYANVRLFGDDDAARAFMEIIDYNSKVVEEESRLTRNILFIRGSKYQWKEVYANIQSALNSEPARIFRKCYLATDKEEIEEIISRDIDGCVDLYDLLQKKFYTGNKHGSKIISYDYKDLERKQEEVQQSEEAITSFIPTL